MSQPSTIQGRDFAQTWQQAMFFPSQISRADSSQPRDSYDIGRIYNIHETTESVAMLVFLSSPGIDNHPELKAFCKARLRNIRARNSGIGKNRPCVVVMPPHSEDRKRADHSRPDILIFATFGGTPYDQIPYVLRHFLDSVLPNVFCTGGPPVSTKPPWTNPKQWLLQFLFQSSRKIEGFWSTDEQDTPDSDSQSSYIFSEETVDVLKQRRKAKQESWDGLCMSDPTFLPKRIEEFKVRCISSVALSAISHSL